MFATHWFPVASIDLKIDVSHPTLFTFPTFEHETGYYYDDSYDYSYNRLSDRRYGNGNRFDPYVGGGRGGYDSWNG